MQAPAAYVTIKGMDVLNTTDVLRVLRERLVPVERAETLFDAIEGQQPTARRSAVLLPLFEQEQRLQLAFIRRASSLRMHSGEIAFPGGKVEPADASPVITALRETQEEIGLHPGSVEILGLLPPVFTVVSNYIITPVVAFLPAGLGSLQLQESEVAELLVASLAGLANPAIAHTEQWTRDGKVRTVYFYDYQSYHIWGATGRILSSLLVILAIEGTHTA
jgi:8-oxo-dGTP pyrophosphatase MutT (NUDIX family)